jgi:hypothetical protein
VEKAELVPKGVVKIRGRYSKNKPGLIICHSERSEESSEVSDYSKSA